MKSAAAIALLCASALCGAPKLSYERIALHQYEDGPVLGSSYEFLPGENAYFSCRLTGYEIDESDESHRKVKLSWRMEVRDPAGVLLAEPAQGRIDAELLVEDTNWIPKFLSGFVTPSLALSGEYKIAVRVKDEIAGNEVSSELKFRVKGHALEHSDRLAVRNFTYLTREDDAFGMRQPFYKPGDTVWARMDVTGYKFGDKNRFSIAFGMALEDSDGKQLFSQPEAGGESNESFYPQPYAPGTLSVNLDKNVAVGTYTLVVTVHDQIANESVEVREPFRVQ